MPKVLLREVAQARSGDKGNMVNIGLFAPTDAIYQTFIQQITTEKVKQHFEGLVEGSVVRYEVPNILALNFICQKALNGGGSSSIRLDNLGKCFGSNLLRMEIEIDDRILPSEVSP
ncbi:hypothetical protein CVD28_05930 [Bacillus sp. M6-12]|uniref:AtuA-related protein n=1 Tax=Bacillus sp. M6-12 TaxID=2054166 RepID=UPI000C77E2B6|nr:hypothetical protein [Bacillus sp. M6-12]PLS18665.1 hypothetical protein CVD28_05930 [Bacillus sp. M6-12]